MPADKWKLLTTITFPFLISTVFLVYRNYYQASSRIGSKSSSSSDFNYAVVEEPETSTIDDGLQTEERKYNENGVWNSLGLEQPLVIIMVGLPARGKSYVVKMLLRYLTWTGFEAEVFNVGSLRRNIGLQSADSSFFDNNNKEAQKIRENMAMQVQDNMYAWLQESNTSKRRVAVFDATNTTRARRQALLQRSRKENVQLLFVESICNDPVVLERNYRLKLQNDDYKGMDPEKALFDFKERVRAYEQVYEVSHLSYISDSRIPLNDM